MLTASTKNPKNLWYKQVSLGRNVDCIISLKIMLPNPIKKEWATKIKVSGIKLVNQYNKLK